MKGRIPSEADPVTEFLVQARSDQMKRYVDGLTGFAIEVDLPDHFVRLLEQLNSAETSSGRRFDPRTFTPTRQNLL